MIEDINQKIAAKIISHYREAYTLGRGEFVCLCQEACDEVMESIKLYIQENSSPGIGLSGGDSAPQRIDSGQLLP